MSFFPLDRGILKSSLWFDGSPAALKVWLYLLLTADRNGRSIETRLSIAEGTKLERGEVDDILSYLSAPDPDSRSKTDEGRRVIVSDRGIEIINHTIYSTKDYSTPRVREWRKDHPVSVRSKKRKGTKCNDEPLLERPTPTPTPTPTENIPATPSRATWSSEACDDWIARFHGTAPGGPIGRHLKGLVDKHGWEVIRPAWRAYLAETEGQYANPARFAATLGTWLRLPAPPAAPAADTPPCPRDPDANDFFLEMKDELRKTVAAEVWATWIRPVEGWGWMQDDQVLVLAAPSRHHADMLRGSFAERLRSAAAERGKELRFLVFVRPLLAPGTHEGSL